MPTIEVFADIWCPFAHVGLDRLVRQRAERGRGDIPLRVRAWPLELVNGVPLDGDAVAQKVEALRRSVAPDLFTGFDRSTFPATTLPALELAAAAYRHGLSTGEEVSLELRQALFEDGRAIDDSDVLDAIAAAAGVDRRDPVDHEAIIADWQEGVRRKVVGSPEFYVDGERFFCPTLLIRHVDGELEVDIDRDRFARFVQHCFDPAA